MLDVAIDAAKKSGEVLKGYFDLTTLEREEKDDKTFVTKADKESEKIIVETIKNAYPDHGIVGEEGTEANVNAEYVWVIDPLDATRNFANGIPIYAISIAVVKENKPVVAVVYNPTTGMLYAAEKGKGATKNGVKIVVSKQTSESGIVTFGPGQKDKKLLNALLFSTEDFFKSKRYLGCTALELAFVARGGTEGFVCAGLNKWDYAAGVLLVEESGGTITDLTGEPCDLDTNYFVASNGISHKDILAMVSRAQQSS